MDQVERGSAFNFNWHYVSAGVWTAKAPRGLFHLRIERVRETERATAYIAEAVWPLGRVDFIASTTALAATTAEAEQWAQDFEARA